MLPVCTYIEDSSPPYRPYVPRKNGGRKQADTSINGKSLRKVVSSPEVSAILKSSSPDDICKQDKLMCEGEELINVLENDPSNLEAVSKFVQKYNDEQIPLNNSDYNLRLHDLNGTIYMGQKYMQESWEELYLSKKTRMQVFGTLENSQVTFPSVPWIILVGEDGYIYAYVEEELRLIAKSLREFVKNDQREIYETFYYPESSEEEDESLQQDEEILKIRQRTRDFVNKSADEFDDFLSLFSS